MGERERGKYYGFLEGDGYVYLEVHGRATHDSFQGWEVCVGNKKVSISMQSFSNLSFLYMFHTNLHGLYRQKGLPLRIPKIDQES